MAKRPDTAQDQEKKKREQLQAQEQKRREAEAKRLIGSFARVAKTEAGRVVLRYFLAQCGFHRPSVVVDSNGDVLTNSTVYNEARRNVWLDARQLMTVKDLIKIEFNPEKEDDDEELDDED